jgi:hypothetical protein
VKCARATALLGDHLEGDLALAVRTEVDEHLRQCSRCNSELHELRSTVALLRSLPTPQPPADLVADVMNRIDSGETRVARLPAGFRRLFDPRVAAPLAAGIAGLVLFATLPGGVGGLNVGGPNVGAPNDPRSANAVIAQADAVATSALEDREASRLASADATSRIERSIWEDRPTTLSGRGTQASASGSTRFRDQPRLSSTERNVAIRLYRSQQSPSIGFYGRTDPDPQYLDLDAHIDRAKVQPEVFLAAVGNTDEADRGAFIAPFAARAARRGDAEIVAGRLRRASHPHARSAADLFEQSWRRARPQPDERTFSR